MILGSSGRPWNVLRAHWGGTALSLGAALGDRNVPVKCLCVPRGHWGGTGQLWGALGCPRGSRRLGRSLEEPGVWAGKEEPGGHWDMAGRAGGVAGLSPAHPCAPGDTGGRHGTPLQPRAVARQRLPTPARAGPFPGEDYTSRRALRRRCPGVLCAGAAMAEAAAASRAPPDVDSDDCLREYRHLFSPDILA